MSKKVFTVLSLSLVMIAASACGPKGPSKAELANHLTTLAESVLPTATATVVKFDTERGGNWVVFKLTDGVTTIYATANLDLVNMNMNWSDIVNSLGAAGINGAEVVTPTGGTYGNYYISAAGNVYEDTGAASKDLEKTAAAVEALRYNQLAQNLSASYGLSEERSYQVAKLTMQWSKLSKTRSMTEADVDSFSKDLFGVNVADAQAAYINAQGGDTASYDALMAQAATTNGVSPEQMRKIVSQFIAQ